MDKNLIVNKTKKFVKNKLEGEGSGHDWWHVLRVYNTSKYIGEKENANMLVVELAALLHDIADWKFNNGSSNLGADLSREFLESLGTEKTIIDEVCTIVKTISFKGGTVDSTQHTIEGKIVQDADRLDAIGAIGIARAFAYGGYKQREIYNPNIPHQKFENFEQYKKNEGTTVNHFYEKLLLLKDMMNTETAKVLAEERHKFMENYLKQFYKEWNCEEE